MATNFYNFGGHKVAESTLLAATTYGANIYNVKAVADIDNGSLVNIDDMEYNPEAKATENGVYTMVAPTATSRVGLVLNPALIYEEGSANYQREDNFYNVKGDILRVYELKARDLFTVNALAITKAGKELAKGQYVTATTTYGMQAVEEKPGTTGFVGKIVDIVNRTNGAFYKIEVLAN